MTVDRLATAPPDAGPTSTVGLKPEQRQAAYTLDRHVSVTAGPGAGKTTVLVERYLHILRTNDLSVDQIVAITFTNRAANEMRERVRRELDEILLSAEPAERARWMRHKRTLDSAIITTIHGFCARLLREFPVEADIDPQFALLDAHQSAMLEEAVVEEAVTECITAQNHAITQLAAGVGRTRLIRGLIGIYRSMRNQGLTREKLEAATAANHKTLEDYHQTVAELTEKMREFIQRRGLPASAEEKRKAAEVRWPVLRDFLCAVSESTSLAEFSEKIQEFRDPNRPSAQGNIRELIQALDDLIWNYNLRGRVPQAFFDLPAKRYALDLINVLERIERGLDEEKRRRGWLDFDDLQLRALRLLEEHPEVMRRTAGRYRFFLIDEFQDTNGLQLELLTRLALRAAEATVLSPSGQAEGRRLMSAPLANLFIVGDRKQSIYGFRGADVDVFREMTARIETQNGLLVPLNRNFRSQGPLISCFNLLFGQVFKSGAGLGVDELNQLGFVEHESSIVAREGADALPVVELLVDLRANDKSDEESSQLKPRERDAAQLADRIISLVGNESISSSLRSTNEAAAPRRIQYRDVALLFRAMTEVHLYESAFRRKGIPYVTVDGKGFYARQEITDFIQLLRFLDNKTDEVALAAVLRSPICGLSDDALLSLRIAPLREGAEGTERLQVRNGVRPLLDALRGHESLDFIDESEEPGLARARDLLEEFIERAKRSPVSELLRFAVEISEYRTVAAASFDGAQRLANIEKMFTLAERFERSGAYLIRDFVRFVRDFEETGGRESEGQIDDSADAVRLMSIHQSKGLEFPVVIIPDLHRQPDNRREWWILDRHRGLTVKVPDGRGRQAFGAGFVTLSERAKRRDEFESMRLLYVAATRAQDRLILSGAAKDLGSLRSSWLGWISTAFALEKEPQSGDLRPSDEVQIRLTVNLRDGSIQPSMDREHDIQVVQPETELALPANELVPLLYQVEPERGSGLHRFSVTQLLNYHRCPRQYYFDRLLHTPGEEEIAMWNDAEAPEPPANLTATLRGAVIHRFCERFIEGDDLNDSLRGSFDVVLRQRAAELADRMVDIDPVKAVHDLLPLARKYLGSKVRQRIEEARAVIQQPAPGFPNIPIGVSSEQRFRVRRPLGILTGTIDKLLVHPSDNGLNVEIIDFKTNRFRGRKVAAGADLKAHTLRRERRGAKALRFVPGQLSLEFVEGESGVSAPDLLIHAEVEAVAADYKIQMQAYALAVRELIPGLSSVRVTLHFLDPDIEVSLQEEMLEAEACRRAIDEAMLGIVSSSAPGNFPAHPADHCRVCDFRDLCPPGVEWSRNESLTRAGDPRTH